MSGSSIALKRTRVGFLPVTEGENLQSETRPDAESLDRYSSDHSSDQLLLTDGSSTPSSSSDDAPLDLSDDHDYYQVRPYADDDALLELEKELEADLPVGKLEQFYDVLGKWYVVWPAPCFPGSAIMLLFLVALTSVVSVLSFLYFPPQNIMDDIVEDASKGFETRGTDIRKAMSTAGRLRTVLSDPTASLSLCPDYSAAVAKLNGTEIFPSYGEMLESLSNNGYGVCFSGNDGTKRRRRSVDGQDESVSSVDQSAHADQAHRHASNERDSAESSYYRVGNIENYFIFVFKSASHHHDNLFDVRAVRDLCHVTERHLTRLFPSAPSTHTAQYVINLPRQIQYFARREFYPCAEITDEEVNDFRQSFFACRHHVVPAAAAGTNQTVNEGVTQATTADKCKKHSLFIFNDTSEYLIDRDYLLHDDINAKVTYSNVLIATRNISELYEWQTNFYLKKVEDKIIEYGDVTLTAVKFPMGDDLKWELFQKYIVSDIRWFVLALVLVVMVMLIYMLRLDLVIATLLSIAAGFVFAYATYFAVFRMTFFPFINILGLLILIAIGADDVFVFFDIFQQVRRAHPALPLQRLIAKTLHHAVSSVFVTSFTTASAFFANAVSDITSVKLFGIFAGTAVILNFFVMIIVVPSVIVLAENLLARLAVQRLRVKLAHFSDRVHSVLCGRTYSIPARILQYTWFVWLIVLTLVGLAGGFIVFIKPRFQLPVTSDFQLLPASNYVENWFLNIHSHFRFADDQYENNDVTLYYMFGFHSNDPGSHLDPDDTDGRLVLDKRFDFYDPQAQVWLRDYCVKTRQAKFMNNAYSSATCLLEAYEQVAMKLCNQSRWENVLVMSLLQPYIPKACCDSTTIPFSRRQMDTCTPLYAYLHENTFPPNQQASISIDVRGRKWIYDHLIYELKGSDEQTNRIAGYVIPVTTKYAATFEYDIMNNYYKELSEKFQDAVAKAPKQIGEGLCAFLDYFWFYDLQHSLATGTYYSIGLSLAVAFVVMFLTSLNIVITCYAMLTIAFAIASTVAVLVLMGWHLNVIESIIISLSVGLSIDFSIHYGVAYRLSKEKTCQARTTESYERVGLAVAMAALTTFLAGASMMPCHVLAYTKLGTFLMLVMGFAWLYSTFFFQSLCWVVGPIGQCFNLRQRYRDGFLSRTNSGSLSVQSGDVMAIMPRHEADRANSSSGHDSGNQDSGGYENRSFDSRNHDNNSTSDGDDDSLLIEFGSL